MHPITSWAAKTHVIWRIDWKIALSCGPVAWYKTFFKASSNQHPHVMHKCEWRTQNQFPHHKALCMQNHNPRTIRLTRFLSIDRVIELELSRKPQPMQKSSFAWPHYVYTTPTKFGSAKFAVILTSYTASHLAEFIGNVKQYGTCALCAIPSHAQISHVDNDASSSNVVVWLAGCAFHNHCSID